MLFRVFRILLASIMACAAFAPLPASADPEDIDAAARGVVRVIIIEDDGTTLYPISHGTGFAVTPERIVTNAHVIAETRGNSSLSIGIVPSDGGEAIYGRLMAYSPRNDLALISTTASMNLPPLTIAGNAIQDAGAVTAVGYPMNVDRAQGLDTRDLFNAQPPVKSRGYLSGRRPSLDFDTLLHTAPIARGNSGGPLLDNCGRVVGVNSFGAESGGTDSEFYFAVSTRELLPFLRSNGITPRINGLPCRSLEELDAAESLRAQKEQLAAAQQAEAEQRELEARATQERRKAEFAILAERDNGMMITMVLLLVSLATGFAAWLFDGAGEQRKRKGAAIIAGLALIGALVAWFTRPGFAEVEERVADALAATATTGDTDSGPSGVIAKATDSADKENLVCVINVERSRITSAETDDIPFAWDSQGCVNDRTQYGLINGKWSRVFVPDTEAVVSLSTYDPKEHQYQVERYLLGHEEMTEARAARKKFEAPSCGGGEEAALELGQNQASITALLPSRPNERLIYNCSPAP